MGIFRKLFLKQKDCKARCSCGGNKVGRQSRQMDNTIAQDNADIHELNLGVPEFRVDGALYCCVFHHPLTSAWVTPHSYPVDYIHVVSNGQLIDDRKTYIDNSSQITIHLVKSELCEKQIVLDEKICYHLPIFDATESWDFIFSNRPIIPEKYLDGYVHQYGNIFARESDLLENKRRRDRYGFQ